MFLKLSIGREVIVLKWLTNKTMTPIEKRLGQKVAY